MNAKYTLDVIPIFPTSVGKVSIGRDINDQEIDSVLKLETHRNIGNSTSKDTYVFRNVPELEEISNFCADAANHYMRSIYSPSEDIQLYVTQSWVNYCNKNDFHHEHTHSNSLISGVLYLQTNEGSDKIVFSKTKTYNRIKITPKEHNMFNMGSIHIPVSIGDLILFDSSLEHHVDPVIGEKQRISISFNTFIKGSVGFSEKMTQLNL